MIREEHRSSLWQILITLRLKAKPEFKDDITLNLYQSPDTVTALWIGEIF